MLFKFTRRTNSIRYILCRLQTKCRFFYHNFFSLKTMAILKFFRNYYFDIFIAFVSLIDLSNSYTVSGKCGYPGSPPFGYFYDTSVPGLNGVINEDFRMLLKTVDNGVTVYNTCQTRDWGIIVNRKC